MKVMVPPLLRGPAVLSSFSQLLRSDPWWGQGFEPVQGLLFHLSSPLEVSSREKLFVLKDFCFHFSKFSLEARRGDTGFFMVTAVDRAYSHPGDWAGAILPSTWAWMRQEGAAPVHVLCTPKGASRPLGRRRGTRSVRPSRAGDKRGNPQLPALLLGLEQIPHGSDHSMDSACPEAETLICKVPCAGCEHRESGEGPGSLPRPTSRHHRPLVAVRRSAQPFWLAFWCPSFVWGCCSGGCGSHWPLLVKHRHPKFPELPSVAGGLKSCTSQMLTKPGGAKNCAQAGRKGGRRPNHWAASQARQILSVLTSPVLIFFEGLQARAPGLGTCTGFQRRDRQQHGAVGCALAFLSATAQRGGRFKGFDFWVKWLEKCDQGSEGHRLCFPVIQTHRGFSTRPSSPRGLEGSAVT